MNCREDFECFFEERRLLKQKEIIDALALVLRSIQGGKYQSKKSSVGGWQLRGECSGQDKRPRRRKQVHV